jgi:hypothetical protein
LDGSKEKKISINLIIKRKYKQNQQTEQNKRNKMKEIERNHYPQSEKRGLQRDCTVFKLNKPTRFVSLSSFPFLPVVFTIVVR